MILLNKSIVKKKYSVSSRVFSTLLQSSSITIRTFGQSYLFISINEELWLYCFDFPSPYIQFVHIHPIKISSVNRFIGLPINPKYVHLKWLLSTCRFEMHAYTLHDIVLYCIVLYLYLQLQAIATFLSYRYYF